MPLVIRRDGVRRLCWTSDGSKRTTISGTKFEYTSPSGVSEQLETRQPDSLVAFRFAITSCSGRYA